MTDGQKRALLALIDRLIAARSEEIEALLAFGQAFLMEPEPVPEPEPEPEPEPPPEPPPLVGTLDPDRLAEWLALNVTVQTVGQVADVAWSDASSWQASGVLAKLAPASEPSTYADDLPDPDLKPAAGPPPRPPAVLARPVGFPKTLGGPWAE